MTQIRKMPSKLAIAKYWHEQLRGKKLFATFDRPDVCTCMACNRPTDHTERAHIKAKQEGGADSVDNLHLLCDICHKDSEMISGDKYFEWFYSRKLADVAAQVALKMGNREQALYFLKNADLTAY